MTLLRQSGRFGRDVPGSVDRAKSSGTRSGRVRPPWQGCITNGEPHYNVALHKAPYPTKYRRKKIFVNTVVEAQGCWVIRS